MKNVRPPGLYWYNGDGHWAPRTLQLELNDKNQWRHTVMDHPAHSHAKLPSNWYPEADFAFTLGEGRGLWTRHEIEDPYVETDF